MRVAAGSDQSFKVRSINSCGGIGSWSAEASVNVNGSGHAQASNSNWDNWDNSNWGNTQNHNDDWNTPQNHSANDDWNNWGGDHNGIPAGSNGDDWNDWTRTDWAHNENDGHGHL